MQNFMGIPDLQQPATCWFIAKIRGSEQGPPCKGQFLLPSPHPPWGAQDGSAVRAHEQMRRAQAQLPS